MLNPTRYTLPPKLNMIKLKTITSVLIISCILLADICPVVTGSRSIAQESTSFGYKIIRTLVKQLNGNISVSGENGTEVTIEF